jgi:hypothetical protein
LQSIPLYEAEKTVTALAAKYREAQVMLILPSQLSSCRTDPIKSEDGKSIDLNSWLVKIRITPLQNEKAAGQRLRPY